MIKFKKLKKSFKNSFEGIAIALKEQNFKIHIIVGIAVILLIIILKVKMSEAAILIAAIIIVMILEIINTALEKTADALKPKIYDYVKEIKDLMAGAVLVACLGAVLIGFLILGPYIADLIF